MCAVEGGRGAVGQRGEGVGRCEEEGRAEAVVGVDLNLSWFGHCFLGDALGLANGVGLRWCICVGGGRGRGRGRERGVGVEEEEWTSGFLCYDVYLRFLVEVSMPFCLWYRRLQWTLL